MTRIYKPDEQWTDITYMDTIIVYDNSGNITMKEAIYGKKNAPQRRNAPRKKEKGDATAKEKSST